MPDLSHVNLVVGASRFTGAGAWPPGTGEPSEGVAKGARREGRAGEAAGAANTRREVLTTRIKQRLGVTILKPYSFDL